MLVVRVRRDGDPVSYLLSNRSASTCALDRPGDVTVARVSEGVHALSNSSLDDESWAKVCVCVCVDVRVWWCDDVACNSASCCCPTLRHPQTRWLRSRLQAAPALSPAAPADEEEVVLRVLAEVGPLM